MLLVASNPGDEILRTFVKARAPCATSPVIANDLNGLELAPFNPVRLKGEI